MVVCNGSNNNNYRIDDPRNVIVFCDLMVVDEEEEEDEKDNKKEKGGFKMKDIEHLGGEHKWSMHLPFQKMDGTEIVMSVHADDKWLVERIRSIVNGKKVCLYFVCCTHTTSLCSLFLCQNTHHSDSKSDDGADGNNNNNSNNNNDEEQHNELFGGQFMVIEVQDEDDEDAEQRQRIQPKCSCSEALKQTTISFSSKCKNGCNKSLSENDIIWECPWWNNEKYHRSDFFMCNECAKKTAKYQRLLSSSSSPPSYCYISLSGAQQLHFHHSHRSSAPPSTSISIPNDVLSASIPIHSKCGWLLNRHLTLCICN